ncbi:MAG: pyruvate/branched-chain alpha-keto acid dehydrogenase component, alpha and beta subunit [Bacteroidota bacterium]|jgi:pyruvate/2-oxoglutarate/acetoin dehydrogenase E1 component/TPP-dependent pyruvate/acetoin dehydrogenase alpha subunit|nr:pyruvate/branched-chain alpha-keto acid dehydrogenase component, alpha and beta subunit [Bacteroidota bacterium]
MSKSGDAITAEKKQIFSKDEFVNIVLNDFKIANESREASLMGRREVLTGKAKFGIFGDGKEIAQLAMAKAFKNGDFRSGYYRDQTFMFATGNLSLQEWFAGLYGHTDVDLEPMSAGRQMGGHFGTRSLNADGSWKDLTKMKNSSPDISPTGGQMPRLLGLAMASKHFKQNPDLQGGKFQSLSNKGNEIAFGTIGDASTSEGLFWEAINAAGVMQVPMLISVWDDGHGISVPKKYQTTKESISEIMAGFQREKGGNGYEIFKTKGWDYAHLCETYEKASRVCREEHVPVLVHVEEVTQPQGHSTSGSHERYKSKERLQWESDFDGIKKMREWILSNKIATENELAEIEENAKKVVREAKSAAWTAYLNPIKNERSEVIAMIAEVAKDSDNKAFIEKITSELNGILEPIRKDIIVAAKKVLRLTRSENISSKTKLSNWLNESRIANHDRYSSYLYSESDLGALNVKPVEAEYDGEEKQVDGRELLRENFDKILSKYPEVMIFGEDSGKIGGVNQGLEGLQDKYGEIRVFDTGIREATIMGQAIGLALRGLRPIAEIQYLDYLLYALQIMSDDLATIQYRTKGGQKAPVIIRTRGHRLEGIWHSGSPMGMIINSIRGIHVCVPRNMTQAAGFYNTLLTADEPALVIEPLNGYRLKEQLPSNIGEYKLPLGVIETINEGSDITLVTYGSCCRIAMEAVKQLAEADISVEVIDVQTLLPFDLDHAIAESVKKTNRLLILDEDVPGGASAFIMQKVLEEQGAYKYLDTEPRTLAAKDHRPAYGSDGDYFSKPSPDDVFDAVYEMMRESDPERFPEIY